MHPVWFSAIGAVLLAAGAACFQTVKRKKGKVLSLIVKGLCTLIPIVFGFLGLWADMIPSRLWMTAGLLLCLAGDIAIGIRFLWGMGAFFIAHVFFLAAFFNMAPFSVFSLVPLVLAVAVAWTFFIKHIRQRGMPALPFLLYCVALFAVAITALSLPGRLGAQGAVFAAGAVLFAISDLLLACNVLIKGTKLWDTVSIFCYYGGIYLLSMGVYLF